jgi:hypothetical protein
MTSGYCRFRHGTCSKDGIYWQRSSVLYHTLLRTFYYRTHGASTGTWEDIQSHKEETEADGIMLGETLLGNPWFVTVVTNL